MCECPTCTDAEGRYEELLEVHAKAITRGMEMEAEYRATRDEKNRYCAVANMGRSINR